MWKKILLIQTCICIVLLAGYTAAGQLGSDRIKEKRSQIVAAMSKHYTSDDIWNGGKKAVKTIIKAPVVVTGHVISAQEKQQYAEPIDPVEEGGVTAVYAVSGGKVIETGNDRELGMYIKIQHDGAVSIYGNCSRIYVEKGKHVRRGQVIGSFMQEENNEFYYNLIEE